MALLPNNTFERNQFAAGRQAIEQTQQLANASRANTPAQAAVVARGGPPPTPQFLVGGITGETQMGAQNFGNSGSPTVAAVTSQIPGMLADGVRGFGAGIGAVGGAVADSLSGPRSAAGSGFTPQQVQQSAQGGSGSFWNMRSPGDILRGESATPAVGAGQPPQSAPMAVGPPPAGIAAPPPASIRAPAAGPDVPTYQAPDTLGTVNAALAAMSGSGGQQGSGTGQPANAPSAPPAAQSTPVAAAGTATPAPMTSTPGVYTDQTAPQMRAAATSGGVPTGGGTVSVMPTGGGYGVGGQALQQPGGQLVDAFMQARDQYLSMDNSNSSLAERGRALNALRALAPQATTEQTAQASMYGDDRALQRGIGVANIGRDATLGSTALTQMGGMDRAVLQAQTQARGQDLTYDVGMANADTNRMNAEAQMAGAQPSVVQQLIDAATLQQFQSGQLGYNDLVRVGAGEAPYTPTPIFNEMTGQVIGMQTGSGVQAPNAELAALLAASGVTTDEFNNFILSRQQSGQ